MFHCNTIFPFWILTDPYDAALWFNFHVVMLNKLRLCYCKQGDHLVADPKPGHLKLIPCLYNMP